MNSAEPHMIRPRAERRFPEPPEGTELLYRIAEALPAWQVRKEVLRGFPGKLYNYLRFDPTSEDSMRNVRTMLVDSKLYLSDPSDFNDPFEFQSRLVVEQEEMANQVRIAFEELVAHGVRSEAERNECLPAVSAMIQRDPAAVFAEAFDTANHGVHCFAPAGKDLLMWSHYADSHKGICLQFTPANDVGVFRLAHPVEYCDEYPVVHIPTIPIADTVAMMMRKGTRWSYEAERRIAMIGINSRLMSFSSRALTGLILGCRFPDNHMPAVIRLLRERADSGGEPIKLYRATASRESYRLSVRAVVGAPVV